MNLERTARGPRRRKRGRPLRPAGARDDERRFQELRHALLGPEQTRIGQLEERPGVSVAGVAGVLPEAIAEAQGTREEELGIALEPPVAAAIGALAARRPEFFGELLSPTIGAAIRKAVGELIATMLERFNHALEQSFSLQSVRWRIEAARTGVSFGEVVLMRTLKYRVEQVFLVHTKTSLVLQNVVDPTVQAPPPDQVAAMLAAIESFGREALGPMPTEARLEQFKFGDRVVWISGDTWITLAAVTRGTASVELGRELDNARERIRLAHLSDVARFEGDVTPFGRTRPLLESLLLSERKQPPRRAHLWLAAIAALAAVVIIATSSAIHSRRSAAEREHRATIEALNSEPGIIVTSAQWSEGRGVLAGLRDPLAPTPEAILRERGLPPATSSMKPYMSLDSPIVQRRAENVLAPPPGVTLAVSDGLLRIEGVAPNAWIDEARRASRSIAGVERYDDSALRSTETLDALRATSASLERIVIPFEAGYSSIGLIQEWPVRRAARLAQRGLELAKEANLDACIQVMGYADWPGTMERNQVLSDERASAVATGLEELGVDRGRVREHGTGVSYDPGNRGRSVTFRLDTGRSSCGGER